MPLLETPPHVAFVRIFWFKDWVAYDRVGAGHGSVEIGGPGGYITWLGGRDRDVIRDGHWRVTEDRGKFGLEDEGVAVPLREGPYSCGLSRAGMLNWWQNFKHLDLPYHLLGNNCDAITVQALRAGGAELFCPSPINLVQGAATLLKWANELQHRILDLHYLIRNATRILGIHHVPNFHGNGEVHIPGLAEWKERSAVDWAVRREQVAAIDGLLAEYHTLGGDQIAKQLDLLYKILALALEHLMTKQFSKRREAVRWLGGSVFDGIQQLEANLA